MIIVQEKLGKITGWEHTGKKIDFVSIEWFESRKRILHKVSNEGREITLRFLNSSPDLAEGDVLYEDESSLIIVTIIECDCIIIQPRDLAEVAGICYEIGNRHVPLFYSNGELFVAFEWPLYRWLNAGAFLVDLGSRKLIHPLKSTISAEPHLSAQLEITKSNS